MPQVGNSLRGINGANRLVELAAQAAGVRGSEAGRAAADYAARTKSRTVVGSASSGPHPRALRLERELSAAMARENRGYSGGHAGHLGSAADIYRMDPPSPKRSKFGCCRNDSHGGHRRHSRTFSTELTALLELSKGCSTLHWRSSDLVCREESWRTNSHFEPGRRRHSGARGS